MPYFLAGQKERAYDLNNAPFETVLGGQYRTTNSAAANVEQVVLTTPSVIIPALATVVIELDLLWMLSVATNQCSFRIRQTNLTGTTIIQGFSLPNGGASSGPYPHTMKGFVVNGASPTTINYVATTQGVTTGNITAMPMSSLIVKQLGGSSVTISSV